MSAVVRTLRLDSCDSGTRSLFTPLGHLVRPELLINLAVKFVLIHLVHACPKGGKALLDVGDPLLARGFCAVAVGLNYQQWVEFGS